MVQLTENQVLSRAKADHLGAVKNLNLWGNELTDVSILQYMPNVEVLSLSVNKISSLADFGKCPKLVELYLRKNNVSDLGEVAFLTGLKALRVLWLCDNPCAETPHYRSIVVRALPQLAKLDNMDITPEERAEALQIPAHVLPESIRIALGLAPGAPGPTAAPASTAAPAPMRMPAASAAAPVAPAARALPVASSAAVDADAPRRPHWQQDRRVVDSIRAAAEGGPAGVPAPAAGGAAVARPVAGAGAAPAPARSSSNVLYAVLALIKELSEEDLRIVHAEMEQRLRF